MYTDLQKKIIILYILYMLFDVLIILQAIDAALTALKCSTTENFVRRQAWELIKCFLVSVMNLEDDKQTLTYLFTHTR